MSDPARQPFDRIESLLESAKNNIAQDERDKARQEVEDTRHARRLFPFGQVLSRSHTLFMTNPHLDNYMIYYAYCHLEWREGTDPMIARQPDSEGQGANVSPFRGRR